ncbi:MAG: radical SAM protein [Deltaproteobacteria bacterium]|nr:radical SAM protein [Deltaproteobacteria bacterium]
MREGRCTQRSSIWGTLWPPVTLAYLSAIAKSAGHDATLVDVPAKSMSVAATQFSIRRREPDLCVVAVSTPSYADDMDAIRHLKNASPSTRFAAIGVHASARDSEVLSDCRALDFVMRGETEGTILPLTNGIARGEFRDIAGLTWRDGDGVLRNPDRDTVTDLDALPMPDWSDVGARDYRLPLSRRRFLCLSPHRGCPYSCSYCTAPAHYGHRVRKRSVENVVAELRRNATESGVVDHFMWADTFTIDRAYVMELCRAIVDSGLRVRWTCNSRLDTVDEEMMAAMAAAGCWMMSFGIESPDPVVLHLANKDPRTRDRKDLYAPLATARRLGIRTVAHFILGLPGDTPDTIRRTVSFARSLPLDFAQFYAAAPFVGSPLHEQAERNGWLSPSTTFARMDQSRASLNLPGLPAREVERVRRLARRWFYASPARAVRLATLMTAQIAPRIRGLFERSLVRGRGTVFE